MRRIILVSSFNSKCLRKERNFWGILMSPVQLFFFNKVQLLLPPRNFKHGRLKMHESYLGYLVQIKPHMMSNMVFYKKRNMRIFDTIYNQENS